MSEHMMTDVVTGAAAAILATLVTSPADCVKVRSLTYP